MDGFNSLIWYCGAVDGVLPTQSMNLNDAEIDLNDIDVDPERLGWNNGGLARALHHVREKGGHALYFNGAALFDNLDDAKNNYLMDPWPDMVDNDDNDCVHHVPFGMVIPTWDARWCPGDDHALPAVTVILFWQVG